MTNDPTLRIELFGIGFDTYWPPFDGLKNQLESYLDSVAESLSFLKRSKI